MKILDAAVCTVQKILAGELPAPEPGKKQAGFDGWYYSLLDVGGDTPPPGKRAGGKPAELWWLEWYGGGPITPAEKLQAQIRGVDAGSNGDYWQLYVAAHRGLLHWWFHNLEDVKIKTTSSVKLQGDLPLIFATRKTPPDSVKVQAGIMLYRQGWQDEAFMEWLIHWVAGQIEDEDKVDEIIMVLLKKYRPMTYSPSAYVKLLGKKRQYLRDGFIKTYAKHNPKVAQAFPAYAEDDAEDAKVLIDALTTPRRVAGELGISEQYLYKLLRKYGFYDTKVKTHTENDGAPTVVRERRVYQITPENIKKLVNEWMTEKAQKEAYTALVRRVAEERGTGLRAAQRFIKRRLAAGKTLEDVAYEILHDSQKPGRN
ncbi:hypothetical protein MTAT_14150 [Moorella thermoacetica]|uniref:Uncharacterized protein n=1 Tax=Neomoorella thermoacetica TaxID=1525 RepID=A0AAC9HHB3_NEOTH|nr:hypothetical protein [Moorella thermoacetica]AOQ23830.1 hypothetical protein Maut_01382 [Moorella thermoacetica]TYL14015.1 hypothetical protein MTAT_14150 [Moorella thermoacetica]